VGLVSATPPVSSSTKPNSGALDSTSFFNTCLPDRKSGKTTVVPDAVVPLKLDVGTLPKPPVVSTIGGNGLWFDVGLDSPDGGCVGLSGRVTMDLSDALDGVLRAKVLERSVKGDFLVGCRVTRVVVGGQVDLGCVSCVGGVREALESCCSVRSDDGGVKLSRGSVWLCVDGNVDVKGVGCLIGVVRSGLRVSVCVAVVFCSMMSFVVVCSVSVC
jgi:hypothetical protein